MPAGDQVTMPAQHRLRAHQQPDPAQYVAGQTVHQRGKQRPISPGQPNLLPVQLPFENRDLVPQREDLGVFVTVAHRQQPQQSERVGHAEVGQS